MLKRKKCEAPPDLKNNFIVDFYNISAQMLNYNPAPETCGFRLDIHDFYAMSAVKH